MLWLCPVLLVRVSWLAPQDGVAARQRRRCGVVISFCGSVVYEYGPLPVLGIIRINIYYVLYLYFVLWHPATGPHTDRRQRTHIAPAARPIRHITPGGRVPEPMWRSPHRDRGPDAKGGERDRCAPPSPPCATASPDGGIPPRAPLVGPHSKQSSQASMSVQRREKQHGRSGAKPYARPPARAAPPAAQPSLLGTLYGYATAPVRSVLSLFSTAEEPEEEYDAASGAPRPT